MALTSPGVQVSVIDESFYTPAEPGTVPMIFVATAENKLNGSGTATAAGTLKANAGKPYLLTSQRDLVENFGDPVFYTDTNNNPIHAGELNEYGLQAAYSILGVSNRAYVVRADVDLGSLQATATAPTGNPANGTHWLDTENSLFGVFEWNGAPATTTGGQTFTNKVPRVINDSALVTSGVPKASVGLAGDYAVVTATKPHGVFYKNSDNTWVKVGSSAWIASHATVVSGSTFSYSIGDTFTINAISVQATTAVNAASLAADINGVTALQNAGISATADGGVVSLYTTGDAIVISGGADFGFTDGTYNPPALQISAHTQIPEFKIADDDRPSGSIWIKTTTPNLGANWVVKRWNSTTGLWETLLAPIYATNSAATAALDSTGGANIPVGTIYVKSNQSEASPALADFRIYRRSATGAVSVTSDIVTGLSTTGGSGGTSTYNFTVNGTAVSFTAANDATDAESISTAINSAGISNIEASVASDKVTITNTVGGDIVFVDTDGALADIGITATTVTNWEELVYTASNDAPAAIPTSGTLWYNSIVDEVDIMVHDGTNWVGYKNEFTGTSATGPTVSATAPTSPAENDLWIDTSDLENYPTIYRWTAASTWELVDKTDQTTDKGIVFADARWHSAKTSQTADPATIAALLESDYVDPDAPDPALYPKGMLLWNLRRSGFNVKRFEQNYIDTDADNLRFDDQSMNDYYPHRWVTESANNVDGSGSFGRSAQRKVVVQALQSSINTNDEIRDEESRIFNLIATPGYPELIGEMITLNVDRGLTGFVVGDSPARLTPDATSLNEWGANVNLAVEDNDIGLVSRDEYLGVYYPWGFTSDNAGNNVVVPPSHMMLRTIALSDQVSFPWFAPAGTRRGGITNATSVGYVNAEGEFVSITLNEGQRDTLYQNNINPITFITGAGLVAFGQKTRARNASSLDRINVARLVAYLRRQLNTLAKPYLFEPNDKITRDEAKQQVESLMLELVGQRALYDYLVVCDESNNTPSRIDRNELWIDIAIEPVKAVEFIYIPVRLKNTGEIAGL